MVSTHEILIVVLITAFVVALTFTFLGTTIFDSLLMVGTGFVSLIVIFTIFAVNVKPGRPSWSAMRPIVQEAATFPHRPPAIVVYWRRLRAGHRLTGDQWATFKHWVRREQEARDKRVVERLTANRIPTRACQPATCRSGSDRHSAHDARDRGN